MRVLAAVFLCLVFSGCSGWNNFVANLRGDSSRDETSDYCRKFRKVDPSIEATGLSNKARDIERDLGAP